MISFPNVWLCKPVRRAPRTVAVTCQPRARYSVAAASISAFLNERVANLNRAMGGDDADLRAALIVSSILGLTIARHFLKLDAFTSATDADISRIARLWVTTGSSGQISDEGRNSGGA